MNYFYQLGGAGSIVPESLDNNEIIELKKVLRQAKLYGGQINPEIDQDFVDALEQYEYMAQQQKANQKNRYKGSDVSNTLNDIPTPDEEYDRLSMAKAGPATQSPDEYQEDIDNYNYGGKIGRPKSLFRKKDNVFMFPKFVSPYKDGGNLPTYKGGNVGEFFGDQWRGFKDGQLAGWGMGNVVEDGDYKTEFGRKSGKFQEKVQPIASDIVGGYFTAGILPLIRNAVAPAVKRATANSEWNPGVDDSMKPTPDFQQGNINPAAQDTNPYGTWAGMNPTNDSAFSTSENTNFTPADNTYAAGGKMPVKSLLNNSIRLLGQANKKDLEVPGAFKFKGDKHGQDSDKDGKEGIPISLDGTRNPVAEIEHGEIYIKGEILEKLGRPGKKQAGGPIEETGDMIISDHLGLDGKKAGKGKPTAAKIGMPALKNLNQIFSRPKDRIGLNAVDSNYEHLVNTFDKQEEGKTKQELLKMLKDPKTDLQSISKRLQDVLPEDQKPMVDTKQMVDVSDPSKAFGVESREDIAQQAPQSQGFKYMYGSSAKRNKYRDLISGYGRIKPKYQTGTADQGAGTRSNTGTAGEISAAIDSGTDAASMFGSTDTNSGSLGGDGGGYDTGDYIQMAGNIINATSEAIAENNKEYAQPNIFTPKYIRNKPVNQAVMNDYSYNSNIYQGGSGTGLSKRYAYEGMNQNDKMYSDLANEGYYRNKAMFPQNKEAAAYAATQPNPFLRETIMNSPRAYDTNNMMQFYGQNKINEQLEGSKQTLGQYTGSQPTMMSGGRLRRYQSGPTTVSGIGTLDDLYDKTALDYQKEQEALSSGTAYDTAAYGLDPNAYVSAATTGRPSMTPMWTPPINVGSASGNSGEFPDPSTDPRITSGSSRSNPGDVPDGHSLEKQAADARRKNAASNDGYIFGLGDYIQGAGMLVDAIISGSQLGKPERVADHLITHKPKINRIDMQPIINQLNLSQNRMNRGIDESILSPALANAAKMQTHSKMLNALSQAQIAKQSQDIKSQEQFDKAEMSRQGINSEMKMKTDIANAMNRQASKKAVTDFGTKIGEYMSRIGMNVNQAKSNALSLDAVAQMAEHAGVEYSTMLGTLRGLGFVIKDNPNTYSGNPNSRVAGTSGASTTTTRSPMTPRYMPSIRKSGSSAAGKITNT